MDICWSCRRASTWKIGQSPPQDGLCDYCTPHGWFQTEMRNTINALLERWLQNGDYDNRLLGKLKHGRPSFADRKTAEEYACGITDEGIIYLYKYSVEFRAYIKAPFQR